LRPETRFFDVFAVTFFEVRRAFLLAIRLTDFFAVFIFFDLVLRAVGRFFRFAITILSSI
jgi:hypothetical protein